MTNNNGAGLNLLTFPIKEEYSPASIKIEEVDEEVIRTETEFSGGSVIKAETVVVGGSWVHQDVYIDELRGNETKIRNLDNSAEQLLKENPVCQSCKMEYKDYCMNCGHLIHILDNAIEAGVYKRAMHSIPKTILEIKGSLTDDYGVYALRNIPKGVKFGPYEGLKTWNRKNKYHWKIRYAKLIEAKGEDYCNWMKYINCATTQSAQNLIALQFMGNMYYKSLREIKIGEELLINYSNGGSDDLGLYEIQYFRPEVEEVNENVFKCLPCHFGFSKEKYLATHNKVCPYKKKTAIEVNSSTGITDFEDNSKICERINNLSTTSQEDNEKVNFDGKEEVLEQDLSENVIISNKEEKEKLKFPHDDNDCTDIKCRLTKKKSYKCKECSYAAARRSTLLNHIKCRHTKEKPYKCNECSYSAVEKINLVSHIKSRHTIEKPYKCNECSFSTIQKHSLLNHIKARHTKEKPYKCNECSYAAVQEIQLLLHIKSRHIKEKPYKCNECPYATVRESTLLTHVKCRHTTEKSYKCNECSYAAGRKSSLLIHIKCCHTNEKPYKCNECSYSAVEKYYLVSHIKSRHTTEKPYKCNECSFATTRKDTLLNHVKFRHTKEKPYKCNECSFETVKKSTLISHIKSWHTIHKS